MTDKLNFLQKAQKYLAWSRKKLELLETLDSNAPIDQHEQHYAELLAHINVASEAILDAAKNLGRTDIYDEVTADRKSDDYLFYFWKARVAEVHHLLAVSDSRSIEFRCTDKQRDYLRESRMRGIDVPSLGHYGVCVAFGSTRLERATRRMNRGEAPRFEALRQAGLEIVSDRRKVYLNKFSYVDSLSRRTINVKTPDVHLGATIPPTVDFASKAVIAYYENKLAQLKQP